jgi:predicted DNA binding CopG/RHH family protein
MNNLDKFEKDILDKFAEDKLISTKNLKEEMKHATIAANNYLTKDKRINIRLSSTDLELLKRKASEEGLPYQTLISSVLHKYVVGRLHNSQ